MLAGVVVPPGIIFPTAKRRLIYFIYAWIWELKLLTNTQWDQLGEIGLTSIIDKYYSLLQLGYKPFAIVGDNPTKEGYIILNKLQKDKTYDFSKYLAVLKSLWYAVKYGHIEPRYISPSVGELKNVKKEVGSNFWTILSDTLKGISVPAIGAGALVIYFLVKPYLRK